MKNPQELKYTEEHLWVRIEEENIATIGITHFAQENMGEMTYVELPETGIELSQGEFLCTVASPKAFVDLNAPLSGEVVAVNEEVVVKPKIINESPYERGWLVKVKATKVEELDDLMNSEAYEGFIENEGT